MGERGAIGLGEGSHPSHRTHAHMRIHTHRHRDMKLGWGSRVGGKRGEGDRHGERHTRQARKKRENPNWMDCGCLFFGGVHCWLISVCWLILLSYTIKTRHQSRPRTPTPRPQRPAPAGAATQTCPSSSAQTGSGSASKKEGGAGRPDRSSDREAPIPSRPVRLWWSTESVDSRFGPALKSSS